MGAPRQKNFIKSRRRVEDDGEEEEGSVAAGVEEDSLSEGSAISDADDDADAEGSDGSDTSPPRIDSKADAVPNGHRERLSNIVSQSRSAPSEPPLAATLNDTEAMMNGLKVSGETGDEGTNFEDLGKQPEGEPHQGVVHEGPVEPPTSDSVGERRRREHEEYKKKRDADPAFVPNRGVFFMHDHRSAAPGQNGFRPFGRGRGRGRGPMGGPYPSFRYARIQHVIYLKGEYADWQAETRSLWDPQMPLGLTISMRLSPSPVCRQHLITEYPPIPTSRSDRTEDHLQPSHNHRIDRFRKRQ